MSEITEFDFEGEVVWVDVENGGRAKIARIYPDGAVTEGIFFKLQSWSGSCDHEFFDAIAGVGYRFRIKVEIERE